nr:RNA-directed DNA polymerase, eukaryota, reverse transcriptase zinc-binding domain protein [Tanacetum cinerariifolium]
MSLPKNVEFFVFRGAPDGRGMASFLNISGSSSVTRPRVRRAFFDSEFCHLYLSLKKPSTSMSKLAFSLITKQSEYPGIHHFRHLRRLFGHKSFANIFIHRRPLTRQHIFVTFLKTEFFGTRIIRAKDFEPKSVPRLVTPISWIFGYFDETFRQKFFLRLGPKVSACFSFSRLFAQILFLAHIFSVLFGCRDDIFIIIIVVRLWFLGMGWELEELADDGVGGLDEDDEFWKTISAGDNGARHDGSCAVKSRFREKATPPHTVPGALIATEIDIYSAHFLSQHTGEEPDEYAPELKVGPSYYSDEMYYDEDGQLTWFNAGVRVEARTASLDGSTSMMDNHRNVIDAFIPDRRSKIGKRFGFIRFIKVANVDRLINNLCTIWIGKFKLHANVARFNRLPLNKGSQHAALTAKVRIPSVETFNRGGAHETSNSYIQASKTGSSSMAIVEELKPSMVLDHSCYNNFDSSLSLVGKLKEFGSLPNIKKILEEEGFVDITIRYMGGFWMLFQFISQGTKYSFESHIVVNSWFSLLQQGSLLHEVEEDDSYFHRKRLCIKTSIGDNIFESFKIIVKGEVKSSDIKEKSNEVQQEAQSEDPFKIYDLLKTKHPVFNVARQSEDEPIPSVENSGGILCVWDTNMFQKENVTVSDYFIAIIGDVIVMGDFNEVRFAEERFRTIFNAHGATVFNSFISPGGLVEVPTGGYYFTWSHKSAAKMSKLDRFLVSEDLMSNCPNLSAVILDCYLSDHRPIVLREISNNILEFNAMLKLIKKLKLLKGCIRTWVRDKKERSQNLKKCLKNKLFDIDISLDKGEATSAMLDERLNMMNDLTSLESNVSLELAQKAKIKWAIEDQSHYLERPFSMEEVKGAVWGCGLNKSPGPDGFTFEFYRRPISLIGSLYKIIAKLLANRLVMVISDLVNEIQSAFIANRQILDGPFMLNEIIHWCKSKKKQTMICKVDFEKAFDSVHWDFLDDVMDNVLASKKKGGLGVSSFYALNCAFTFKWIWRFRTQGSSLWSRVIKLIHREDGKIGKSFKHRRMSNGNNITRGVTLLQNKGIDLLGYIKKKTENGENTLFWGEVWKSDVPFSLLNPRIFALKSCKFITVANKLAHSSLASSLIRNPRGGDGEFWVASVRNLIDDKTLTEVGAKTRWSKYVPIKVNIFAWRINLNNLLSRLNLSRRGLDLDTIFCPSCNSAVECSNHIFFGFPMVKDLYKFLARWWDVSMTTFFSYDEWWNWFSNLRVPSKLKLIFEGVFYISWWVIWNYRNKVIFGPGHQSKIV